MLEALYEFSIRDGKLFGMNPTYVGTFLGIFILLLINSWRSK
jgi:hypothetical protein